MWGFFVLGPFLANTFEPFLVDLFDGVPVLGTIFAVVQGYGMTGGLLAFTAAHGPLEMSAIVLSGGAGLRLAWAILRPGERSRRDALRLAGAQAVRVMLLVTPALGVAGILEGFLSPSNAPLGLKVTAGFTAFGLLWLYILAAGRGKGSMGDRVPVS